MTEDEYDLIAARIQEKMQEKFAAILSSQDLLHSNIDKQLVEIKAITEKTASIQLQPVSGEARQSAPGPSREEDLSKGCTNIVRILPGSIRFPVSFLGMQGQIVHPLDVNLPEVPVDQLREIFQQIGTELKEREMETYAQNATLVKKNV